IDVPEGKKKERIDIFLTHHIENTTRSKIQKAIESGLVRVNGIAVKANYSVKPFDKIEAIQIISPRPEDIEPEEIPLDIVFEDDYLIVVNKPAGMVAHPAYANYTGTLVNALLHYSKSLSDVNEAGRPGIVHRIDKNTSGLLVVAKDDFTHAKLAAQFSKHTIEREYHTICWGRFKQNEGEIATKITRSKSDRKKFAISETEGKEAITFYKVIEQFEFTTYLKLNLKTGRTHQIRVHLSGIGKPVFGDTTYCGNKIQAGFDSAKIKSRIANLLEIMPRQALHAKTLGFIHPHTNKSVRFDSELPNDFKLLLKKLRS
ncbi:MAG: RluA family pseudouridine synthase, partial [Ignavibacteriaceae bacterium]|nr:RluA family pseudouridine synthase [Ignavibacteriaceae bacterium]